VSGEITIASQGEILRLNALVHDAYLNIREVVYDDHRGQLRLPLRIELPSERRFLRRRFVVMREYLVPEHERLLTVHHVREYKLRTAAEAESWDLVNEVTFKDDSRELLIRCSLAHVFWTKVDSLCVTVLDTGKRFSERRALSVR